LLRDVPERITIRELERFPEFHKFRSGPKQQEREGPEVADGQTSEETLEDAYQKLRGDLAVELLTRVKDGSAEFFERLVVELLLSMGYGGSRREAGEAIGKAGDEGIDGIINLDRLGLEAIYIQAKKWGVP